MIERLTGCCLAQQATQAWQGSEEVQRWLQPDFNPYTLDPGAVPEPSLSPLYMPEYWVDHKHASMKRMAAHYVQSVLPSERASVERMHELRTIARQRAAFAGQ